MNPFYPVTAVRAEYRCEYCHAPDFAFNFAFEVEHIHPRSQGDDSSSGNLALSCASCNGFKMASSRTLLLAEKKIVPDFRHSTF